MKEEDAEEEAEEWKVAPFRRVIEDLIGEASSFSASRVTGDRRRGFEKDMVPMKAGCVFRNVSRGRPKVCRRDELVIYDFDG
jgi:hypothetical protein